MRVLRRQSGVSLIELITVMFIVGMLTAIAIPAYRQYVIRTNRTEAKTTLMSIAGELERCYTRFNTYVNPPCTVANTVTSGTNLYTVTVARPRPGQASADTTFLLTAVPQGTQARDTGCANLTLNEIGQRNKTGTKTVQDCWGK